VDVVVFFALAQPHTRERTVLIVLRNMGKDKATRAKELAKDTAGAVSEEVARGAGEIKDAAKPMAGSVGTSVKDAVASGVETVGETAKDAASTVTSAVSSAIKKVPQGRPRARGLLARPPPTNAAPQHRRLGEAENI
jgi:hypothetical protein